MTTANVRERLATRLIEDLMGPSAPDEILRERPTERYTTGILYPQDTAMRPEEDEDGGGEANPEAEEALMSSDPGVALYAARKPSTAGLSFAVRSSSPSREQQINVRVRCATYQRFAVDDDEQEVEGEPKERKYERWRRIPSDLVVPMTLNAGQTRIDLTERRLPGAELYLLVMKRQKISTCTVAVTNLNRRGGSRAIDEARHFFQCQILVSPGTGVELVPRPSRKMALDEDGRVASLIYRDYAEYAVGHNSSATVLVGTDGSATAVETTWVPMTRLAPTSDRGAEAFETLRRDRNRRPLSARWLSEASPGDLVAGLKMLQTAYSDWIDSEQGRIRSLPSEYRDQAARHIEVCRQAARRIGEGITLIESNESVRTAFQLANSAMRTQFEWSRDVPDLEWRPFQLGFQLLSLASVALREHPDRNVMDLLWFPTGGGKTEAYLGLIAFVIFLRRLRAREDDDGSGVAALMRYTLRALTIQQFQRAAAMICASELLRRQRASRGAAVPALGDNPISIGLWVGAGATPLTLQEARSLPPDAPSTPNQLPSCPACKALLQWRPISDSYDVRCTDKSCLLGAAGAALPVWTIDELVYREKPSLIVATVDKFAQIVRKPETRVLFGEAGHRAPPDLIIQDELHLVSGPLGTLAGLYEVAIDELCRRESVRPKIIGSTATIRRASEQIRALFDRKAYQFPPPGLDASSSGFATTDISRPGRLYVGITTAGRSAKYILQAVAASLSQGAKESGPSLEEIDPYWTLVCYFNSLRELGGAVALMQDDVPVSIRQYAARRGEERRPTGPPDELTSRVKSYEIRDMLDRLNRKAGDPEAVDVLLASNMISVGVDIPRLGLMIVNSQPKSLAEYIQATSRVGRGDVPGVAVTIYNSTRARDRSHYETFVTWHGSLYREVEASSVTPFASRAQDKALHAVLVALARHLIPEMRDRPALDDLRQEKVEALAELIERRAASVDAEERLRVAQKLEELVREWASRPDLQAYWDDFGNRTSLLISAEQYAAQDSADAGGARRALWPTPNSMREVEAGTPFVLRPALRLGEG